ncbi:hypothetical protein BG015_006987 [Linnemannia schmuckeri]|uniref:Uncharacterized protein n=1 Tax=Linnemannia schmuckeri TaxID=64567 RepID=A0A9P5VBN0_9FUNG|nr:hypothetical protein BG015_006987 [Linnemannia schmuckeri]
MLLVSAVASLPTSTMVEQPCSNSSQYQPDGGSSFVAFPTSSTPASCIPTSVTTVITRTQSSASPVVTSIIRSSPSEIPVTTQSKRMSGCAIAGTVFGILGALGLAGFLGWCWRRGRAAHVPAVSSTIYVSHAPTRTVVSEKIEPLVVNFVNGEQTYHGASVPAAVTAAGAAGGAAYASRSQPSGSNTGYTSGSNGHIATQPDSTYNTTVISGGNPTTTGSGNAGQSGNNNTIYSSNNGYSPKPHN